MRGLRRVRTEGDGQHGSPMGHNLDAATGRASALGCGGTRTLRPASRVVPGSSGSSLPSSYDGLINCLVCCPHKRLRSRSGSDLREKPGEPEALSPAWMATLQTAGAPGSRCDPRRRRAARPSRRSAGRSATSSTRSACRASAPRTRRRSHRGRTRLSRPRAPRAHSGRRRRRAGPAGRGTAPHRTRCGVSDQPRDRVCPCLMRVLRDELASNDVTVSSRYAPGLADAVMRGRLHIALCAPSQERTSSTGSSHGSHSSSYRRTIVSLWSPRSVPKTSPARPSSACRRRRDVADCDRRLPRAHKDHDRGSSLSGGQPGNGHVAGRLDAERRTTAGSRAHLPAAIDRQPSASRRGTHDRPRDRLQPDEPISGPQALPLTVARVDVTGGRARTGSKRRTSIHITSASTTEI